MFVIGVDEAGRGPLAGPVVAAAVAFKKYSRNKSFKDSKQLSRLQREELVGRIHKACVAWSVVAVGPRRIEHLNIREATREAMRLAVARLPFGHVLIDGNVAIRTDRPQTTVVKGDQLHFQISAASILAKVWRDDLMVKLDRRYQGYEFSNHFGYPTESHRKLLSELGPCRIHRRTFSGVREWFGYVGIDSSVGGGNDAQFDIFSAPAIESLSETGGEIPEKSISSR